MNNIQELQQAFLADQRRRSAYTHAMTILSYDAETVMPAQGAASYGETMGVLAGESFKLLMSSGLSDLLAEMKQVKNNLPLWMQRESEELERSIRKLRSVPQEDYIAFQTAMAVSGQAWREAKQHNDYGIFAPHLQKMLDFSRRFASAYDSSRPLYDVMLEDYENGLTMQQLDPLFDNIRTDLAPLINSIAAARQPDSSFLQGVFAVEQQRELAAYIMELMTVDRSRCALGESEHPFTTETNNRDVRITTHYYTDDLLSGMFSVIHESGHALYSLHMADDLNGSSLINGSSYSIHESISRFFENYIGRSPQFTSLILKKLQQLFPARFTDVTPEQFYRACNISHPSTVRTEADELTYPLHIMVRYEMEKRLVSGSLTVEEAPAEWNRMYREYLGVDVPDDRHGILQDMHWSDASFGYFPTYALGSAYGAQFLAKMEQDIPVWELVEKGDLSPIVNWLSERIFVYGGAKKPSELLHDICGGEFDPHYYIDYLSRKYRKLYAL